MCDPASLAAVPARHVRALRICAAAVLLAATPAVAGEAPDLLTDRFNVSLGSFIVNSDVKVRLDGESGQGTEVDWERTFGDQDATRFRIDGQWRFADRHKLRFLWFNYSRSRSKSIEEEIEWGDEVFPVNVTIESKFAFDVYELAYEYAFLRRENFELGASIGLHYTELSVLLAARAASSGGSIDGDIAEEGSVGAPLPVIGLRGVWALPHDFWVDASAQVFALSIDEYDGSLQDFKVAVTWQPRPWLGIGLGYNRFGIDVDVDSSDFSGSLDWTYSGPMIQYSAAF